MPREVLTADDLSYLAQRRCEKRRRRCLIALVLAGGMVGQAATALAAEAKTSPAPKSRTASEAQKAPPTADLVAAKQAYEEALRAFNLGQWDEAIAGFKKSYKLSGDAALLFNVAQAQRQAGHAKEAIIAYKAFLRERPEAPNRAMIEAKIKDLESAAEAKTAAEKPRASPAQTDRLTGVWEDPFHPKPDPFQPMPGTPAAPPDNQVTSSTAGPAVAPLAPPVPSAGPPPPSVPPVAAVASPPMAEAALASPPSSVVNEKAAPAQEALDLRQKPASENPATASGSRWWLWTGIGAVVAAGVVTAILLSTRSPERDGTCTSGLDGCIVVGK